MLADAPIGNEAKAMGALHRWQEEVHVLRFHSIDAVARRGAVAPCVTICCRGTQPHIAYASATVGPAAAATRPTQDLQHFHSAFERYRTAHSWAVRRSAVA